MRIPEVLRRRLLARAIRAMASRPADDPIGPKGNPYLERWHLLPKRACFNFFLHRVRRSDDERALHDHPWWNLSIILEGGYLEIVPADRRRPAGPTRVIHRQPGSVILRRATAAHRLVLLRHHDAQGNALDLAAAITLFATGPVLRPWGFWCPQGWRSRREFTATADGQPLGRGCE